jgi:hypothetical protein
MLDMWSEKDDKYSASGNRYKFLNIFNKG